MIATAFAHLFSVMYVHRLPPAARDHVAERRGDVIHRTRRSASPVTSCRGTRWRSSRRASAPISQPSSPASATSSFLHARRQRRDRRDVDPLLRRARCDSPGHHHCAARRAPRPRAIPRHERAAERGRAREGHRKGSAEHAVCAPLRAARPVRVDGRPGASWRRSRRSCHGSLGRKADLFAPAPAGIRPKCIFFEDVPGAEGRAGRPSPGSAASSWCSCQSASALLG